MPTANDFEDAAARLRNVVAGLEDFVHPLENRMGSHVLEGGELTDSVYESLKSTRVETLSLSAVVEEYAAECTRRMEEANAAAKARDDYEDDLSDYREMKELWDANGGKPVAVEKGLIGSGEDRVNHVGPDKEPVPPTPPPDPPDYIDI